MTEKEVTTVLTPTGSYQILAHTKDKKKGTILGEYSTEPKAVRALCAIQVAADFSVFGFSFLYFSPFS